MGIGRVTISLKVAIFHADRSLYDVLLLRRIGITCIDQQISIDVKRRSALMDALKKMSQSPVH